MKNLLILSIMAIVSTRTVTVQSTAFSSNGFIPAKYTCSGSNINPPISIKDIPAGTKSLALILDDPDAPKGTFVHWVMWNIPVQNRIEENSAPGIQGKNGKGENSYTGPCPPSGTHRYHFKVYALDTKLDLPASTDKDGLIRAMAGHALGMGELTGLYKK